MGVYEACRKSLANLQRSDTIKKVVPRQTIAGQLLRMEDKKREKKEAAAAEDRRRAEEATQLGISNTLQT